jgi:hypothetical protein
MHRERLLYRYYSGTIFPRLRNQEGLPSWFPYTDWCLQANEIAVFYGLNCFVQAQFWKSNFPFSGVSEVS